jgi:ADP-heptose:LPS heptosyltransferase
MLEQLSRRSNHDRSVVPTPKRLDALLFTLPALDALAASGRRLTAVTSSALVPLAERIPGVVEVAQGLAELPECGEAVVLSRGPEDGPLAELGTLWALHRSGVQRRWGYDARGPARLLTRWLLAPGARPPSREALRQRHAGEDFRELLEAMEVPPPESWAPRLEISDELRRAAWDRLERGGIPPATSPRVALLPGGRLAAERGDRVAKESRWPWERFAELARTLRQQVPGLRCVLVAGQEPLWPAVRIHEETARFVPLIGPDLDAAGLAGLLAACDLAVAADSELLHLAAAVGTPTVALFGPTDPDRRAPRGERHQVIEAPAGDLRHLETEPVLKAAREILESV